MSSPTGISATEGSPSGEQTTQAPHQSDGTDSLHFATFFAHNSAAIHLLTTIQARSPSECLSRSLVFVGDNVGYNIELSYQQGDLAGSGVWRIGSGMSWSMGLTQRLGTGVDILLCPPRGVPGSKEARKSVAAVHAKIHFHPISGALILRSLCPKPIVYLGNGLVDDYVVQRSAQTALTGPTCVLFQECNRLRFGDYEFSLDFAELRPQQSADFESKRNDLILEQGSHFSRHLEPLPSRPTRVCWNVWVHRTLYRDSQALVYSGVHLHSGEPVAVKRLRCKRNTRSRVRRELRNAQILRGHDGVLGMTESWCEHALSPPCGLSDERDVPAMEEDVYYSRPLAEFDFESAPWDKLDMHVRIKYCWQTLIGLRTIHDHGMIHGGIRPSSLVLFADRHPRVTGTPTPVDEHYQLPMAAAISSLGCPDTGPARHDAPPFISSCVAPEVWPSNEGNPYDSKADIWSLAVCWLCLFQVLPKPVMVGREEHRTMASELEHLDPGGMLFEPMRDLLRLMLAWNPEDRPTAEQALSHDVWRTLRSVEVTDREDRRKAPEDGAKRVRVLSPDDV